VNEWLNTFIAPHQLVSVSFHEEMHPNNSGQIGAIITHTAGVQPKRLSETIGGALPAGGLY
jgi:hypothetical protein